MFASWSLLGTTGFLSHRILCEVYNFVTCCLPSTVLSRKLSSLLPTTLLLLMITGICL
jgi:hypothetical protein